MALNDLCHHLARQHGLEIHFMADTMPLSLPEDRPVLLPGGSRGFDGTEMVAEATVSETSQNTA